MNRKVILTIVIGLLVIAAAVGVGFTAFRMGQAYGISQSPAVATALANRPAGSDGVPPFAGGSYAYGFGMGRPFGGPFGGGFEHWGPGPAFGFLRCLIPLFFLFLLFAFFRLVFRPWGWRGGWGGPWGRGRWGHHGGPDGQGGPEGHNVPPMFEEWHRRAHGETPPTPPTDTPPSTNA
jgi:hypothetical protein